MTVTIIDRAIVGRLRAHVANITLSGNYTTGGYAELTLAMAGFTKDIYGLEFLDAGAATGYIFKFDSVNRKIKAFWVPTGTLPYALAEVANGTAIGTVNLRAIIWGR